MGSYHNSSLLSSFISLPIDSSVDSPIGSPIDSSVHSSPDSIPSSLEFISHVLQSYHQLQSQRGRWVFPTSFRYPNLENQSVLHFILVYFILLF